MNHSAFISSKQACNYQGLGSPLLWDNYTGLNAIMGPFFYIKQEGPGGGSHCPNSKLGPGLCTLSHRGSACLSNQWAKGIHLGPGWDPHILLLHRACEDLEVTALFLKTMVSRLQDYKVT